MSRWSPVYVPEIETGRHVKNNACAVEIKIKDTKTYDIRNNIPGRYISESESRFQDKTCQKLKRT
jgi:hypothetical protein